MFRTPTRRALPLAFIPPCIPTWSRHAPVGRDRVHEIKHDGYRLMVRRQGARVRLFTRRGFDWSHRFPLIVEAAGSLRVISISIDGEAVVCGDDGISDFDRLHSQGWDSAVFLYAFDVLEIDGDDLRQEPLERRKKEPAWVNSCNSFACCSVASDQRAFWPSSRLNEACDRAFGSWRLC
jgi:ATP-dependent DNA ligase